jgi:iron complex transport system substrate-binding protein
MRIVSLLASGTEIVCALGAGDSLVGRSHECDNPAWVRSLPACSEPAFDISVSSREIDAEVNRRIRSQEPLYRIDTDRLRELAPDLVIAQVHCEVCAVTASDLERDDCGMRARVLALSAGSLDGIYESILLVARALSREKEGIELVRREKARLEAVRSKAAGRRRPSVVMLEWADPVFAMANWGPELVEIANGELLLGRKGQHSSAIPGEWVAETNPEYLIVAPCGFSMERAVREQSVLETYPWWSSLRAVKEEKVAFADGNLFFNRSGMTVTQTAEIIAEILHGFSSGDPTENKYWRWYRKTAQSHPVVPAGRVA